LPSTTPALLAVRYQEKKDADTYEIGSAGGGRCLPISTFRITKSRRYWKIMVPEIGPVPDIVV
jgi:hypothetical protein